PFQGLDQTPGCQFQPGESLQHTTGRSGRKADFLVRGNRQGQRSRTHLGLGRSSCLGHLQRMLAADFTAVRADSLVGDQPCDVRSDRGDVLNELLDRLKLGYRPSATRARRQRYLSLLVHMIRNDAVKSRMPWLAPRPLLLILGNLLTFGSTKRSGLSCGGP